MRVSVDIKGTENRKSNPFLLTKPQPAHTLPFANRHVSGSSLRHLPRWRCRLFYLLNLCYDKLMTSASTLGNQRKRVSYAYSTQKKENINKLE